MEAPLSEPPAIPGPPPRVYSTGVFDAVSRGWRLVAANISTLWVIGLLAYLLQAFLGVMGAAPYMGALAGLAIAIFAQPPLTAGLVYAIRLRADGRNVRLEDLFEGFKQRYWQAVVTAFPPLFVGLTGAALIVAAVLAVLIPMGIWAGVNNWDTDKIILAIVLGCAAAVPVALVLMCVMLFFVFTPVAVWDHPESGWAAVKTSARIVRAHFWSVAGLSLIFAAIYTAAAIAGLLACCVGVFFTIPFALVWHNATLVHIYRTWTVERPPEDAP
ncbi:MAG: hypothetical protein HY897_07950 [Deltaproteobacteria bacterium]|nr:hypothetical protein [Deltaproteobacteria bacterium]